MRLDEAGTDIVGLDGCMLQQVLQKLQVAAHPFQTEFAESAVGAAQHASVVVIGLHNQFGDQRIKARAGGVAAIAIAVYTYAGAAGRLVGAQGATCGACATVLTHALQVNP